MVIPSIGVYSIMVKTLYKDTLQATLLDYLNLIDVVSVLGT
jgi:hypothetical protein